MNKTKIFLASLILILAMGINTVSATVYHTEGTEVSIGPTANNYYSATSSQAWDTEYVMYYDYTFENINVANNAYKYKIWVYSPYTAGTLLDYWGSTYGERLRYIGNSISASGTYNGYKSGTDKLDLIHIQTVDSFTPPTNVNYFTYNLTVITGTAYNITGTIGCIENIHLYYYDGSNYQWLVSQNVTGETEYDFGIVDGTQYKILFDTTEYVFTCSGDVVYDKNECPSMYIYLKDYCGNMMQNTSVDIYSSDAGAPATYEFVGNYHRINPIVIIVDEDIDAGKMLDIYFDTDMGTYHQIEYCSEQTVDILHPFKWWAIHFGAFDLDTHDPIPNIKMHVNQSCKPDPTRLLSTYAFTGADGYALFTGLSAQKVYVRMDNDQYTGDRFWVDGLGDAFHTYHIIDTYLNISGNPDWYNGTDNMSIGCNIHFKDQSGHVDNHINDTDTYVDLYYDNGNCSATLKFQRLYATYWMSKMTWNIPINESGYKRVYNVNFSDYDANYRGYMYATECECNSTLSLYVTNETVQEDQHYENLTTYIQFNHQLGSSQVDYRSPVSVKAYAYTNTSAYLLNINLTLYEQTNQIATIALDWADFAGASPKWYYVWEPSVSYNIGKNYTVVMTGYNGLNLGADDVWTSNIRNNKLTIYVKDNHNSPIDYATVFIEGWGSHALESATFAEIEGFDNGGVQYKATKSGYTSSGWSTVTFDDNDETVTCILVKESTTRVTGYKLRNNEIKEFFIPIMYLLLMFMLLGAFMHVNRRR